MNFVIPEKGNETGNKCFLMDLKFKNYLILAEDFLIDGD